MKATIDLLFESILDGNKADTVSHVKDALEKGLAPEVILNDGMISAMQEVGKLFEDGEYFVPEMLVSARAMQSGLEILRPILLDADVEPAGKVVMGTVQGDQHDIGKNLVSMMLEGAGYEIIDLKTDVAPQAFVDAVVQHEADIVGLSALLTTTMPNMASAIQALEEAGLRDKIKVIVGGAPVTHEYADKIDADGFAPDASQAVKLAQKLLGQ